MLEIKRRVKQINSQKLKVIPDCMEEGGGVAGREDVGDVNIGQINSPRQLT